MVFLLNEGDVYEVQATVTIDIVIIGPDGQPVPQV